MKSLFYKIIGVILLILFFYIAFFRLSLFGTALQGFSFLIVLFFSGCCYCVIGFRNRNSNLVTLFSAIFFAVFLIISLIAGVLFPFVIYEDSFARAVVGSFMMLVSVPFAITAVGLLISSLVVEKLKSSKGLTILFTVLILFLIWVTAILIAVNPL